MENAVRNRGIEFLVHFTQASNLESIITNGIISVLNLENRELGYSQNDYSRLDNCRDASCFSIEFPNYKYFYPLRLANPNIDWVVLVIKKEVLWEKDCLFCKENAASNNVRFITREERRDIQAFNEMYAEYPGKPFRRQLGIPESYTTNPQAEVLVIDVVEPHYIWGVVFESDRIMKKYIHLIPGNMKPIVHKEFFGGRCDYQYWGNGVLNG